VPAADIFVPETETEMGKWVMGQMGHHFWVGHTGHGPHGSLPVAHWPVMK